MLHEHQTEQHFPFEDAQTLLRAYPGIYELLRTHMDERRFQKDHPVFFHGDAAHSFWYVVQGWVKLARQTPDGKETVVALCTEGDLLSDCALFENSNYNTNANVISETAILGVIPAVQLRRILNEHADIAKQFMQLMQHNAQRTQLNFEHLQTMSAAQRLGCFIMRLCDRQNKGPETIYIPVEKHILANHLGMKAETLSRSQQQLRDIGVYINGNEVRIDKIESLLNFVCVSCSDQGQCTVEQKLCAHSSSCKMR